MPEPSSARHQLPYLSAGQAQKELTHNEALALIDAGLQPSAVSMGLDLPPPDPQPGACWLVGPAPGGVWAGHAGALACWTSSGWRFLLPRTGMRVWLEDQQVWAERRGSDWVAGEVTATKLAVDGQQVVGARGAAVAAPSGGATIDAEARDAIQALIARLVAHGLITASPPFHHRTDRQKSVATVALMQQFVELQTCTETMQPIVSFRCPSDT